MITVIMASQVGDHRDIGVVMGDRRSMGRYWGRG